MPKNLVAPIPDGVAFDAGGLRAPSARSRCTACAAPRPPSASASASSASGSSASSPRGSLRAAGCETFGIDLDPAATELARARTGHGVPTRSTPRSKHASLRGDRRRGPRRAFYLRRRNLVRPARLASQLARDRGRLVLVGDVPVEVDRSLLYEKELELRLSRSYGPGRYDREYEERGRDLPDSATCAGPSSATSQAFRRARRGADARPVAADDPPLPRRGGRPRVRRVLRATREARAFGVLLEYAYEPGESAAPSRRAADAAPAHRSPLRVGLVGAGAFARSTLLPALKARRRRARRRRLRARPHAPPTWPSRFGFDRAAHAGELLADESIDAVVIATRHGSARAPRRCRARRGQGGLRREAARPRRGRAGDVEDALAARRPADGRLQPPLRPARGAPARGARAAPAARCSSRASTRDRSRRTTGFTTRRRAAAASSARAATSSTCSPTSRASSARRSTPSPCPLPSAPLESSDDVVAHAALRRTARSATLVYTGSGDPSCRRSASRPSAAGLAAVLDDFRRLELYRGGQARRHQGRHRTRDMRADRPLRRRGYGRGRGPPVASYLASTRATLRWRSRSAPARP